MDYEILQRKIQAEESLRKGDIRFKTIFENAPVGMALASYPDGNFSSVNDSFCNMLGYSSQELQSMNFRDITHPDDLEISNKEVYQLIAGDINLIDIEKRYICKDANIVWSITTISLLRGSEGNPVNFVAHIQDITERKNAETEYRRRFALDRVRASIYAMGDNINLKEIMVSLSDALREVDIDYENCSIQLLGEKTHGIAVRWGRKTYPKVGSYTFIEGEGVTPDETLNINTLYEAWRKQQVLYRKDLYMEDPHNERKIMKDNYKDDIRCILDIPFPNGTIAINSLKPNAFSQRDIELIKAFGNILSEAYLRYRDITQRNQAEEQLHESNRLLEEAIADLKAAQQQVIQQERLRALGQLASGIAHDFNNALTPILGYSNLLLSRHSLIDDKEKITRYLNMIRTSASDAAEIVRRLQELYRSREESEIFPPVNLNQLIQQVVLLTQPKWKSQAQANGVTIELLTDLHDIPIIPGKEYELREALTNLIFNSVDALTANGTISLRTRADGKHAVIEVSDTGIGMTDDVKEHCFDAFFSTKGTAGTGLGLSIVYGIIQRHGGTIDVKSEPGKGTTFIIRLPVMTDKRDKEKAKEDIKPLRPLHILIVDDEQPVRSLLGDYLSFEGHTYETASTGREGLDKFTAGNYDLVITDRAMPDIGGDQLTSIIKQLAPGVPIIMMTGFGSIMELTGEMPEGVDRLISKPMEPDELRDALFKVFAQDKQVLQC